MYIVLDVTCIMDCIYTKWIDYLGLGTRSLSVLTMALIFSIPLLQMSMSPQCLCFGRLAQCLCFGRLAPNFSSSATLHGSRPASTQLVDRELTRLVFWHTWSTPPVRPLKKFVQFGMNGVNVIY